MLNRKTDEKIKFPFRTTIKTILGSEADVKTGTHAIEVEILELDEATTKDDVTAALGYSLTRSKTWERHTVVPKLR